MKNTTREAYADGFKQFFTEQQTSKLLTRLDRISFKIAPINSATGNTQTMERSELDLSNPQYASREECQKIFDTLAKDLLGHLGARGYKTRQSNEEPPNVEDIRNALTNSSRLGSLELPVTYESFKTRPIHTADNLFWFKPAVNSGELEQWVGSRIIVTKIQVKAFLTDRRQTGEYQTNREVRWETHPHSPQFATRKDCIGIAEKLMAQIATFNGAPTPSSEMIVLIEQALGIPYKPNSFRCPISGKQIIYADFVSKVTSPVHGRSGYQVGHMNPLASTGGHVAANISWITDLGNRVQGEESLDDITQEIFYMATFHKRRLGKDWAEVEKYFS